MRRLIALALLVLISSPPPHAIAQERATDSVDPPTAAEALDRRAWAAEVRAMRAAERSALAPLVREARLAPSGSRAQAQRALEDAKRDWRRRTLSAQLVRMRAAGLTEQSQRIEQRIAELDAVRDRRVLPAAPAGGDQ